MKYLNRKVIPLDESLTLSSIRKRSFAILVDIFLLALLFALLQVIFQLLGFDVKHVKVEGFTHVDIDSDTMSTTEQYIIRFIYVCIPSLYFTLTTYFLNGQSFGKKLFRIKVISLYHSKIGFWHCIERSLGYVASSLEFGLGFIQAFWNPNKMSLHDRIAETIVVNC